jgi:SAM-dependent methyltransferase
MKNWCENDAFWLNMEPFLFDEEHLKAAPLEVEQMIALVDLEPESFVLDLCCGTGRHTLEFARKGHYVTGVDRTKIYLEKARNQARREKLSIDFIQADMRAYSNNDTFDLAIMMFTSFGYFTEPEENKQVLRNVHASLKTKGVLIMELMGKEVLARIFQDRGWREIDGTYLLEDRKMSEDWRFINNRWIVFKGGKIEEFSFKLRIYSAVELADLIKKCGFGSVDIYGNLQGGPYDQSAVRLFAVARK